MHHPIFQNDYLLSPIPLTSLSLSLSLSLSMDSGNRRSLPYSTAMASPPTFVDSLPFLYSSPLHSLDPSPPNLTVPAPPPPQAPSSAPRSTKKRSRASRRAPTTVLTTDTTNFRAMVQEFTGIPSPPFSSSSSPLSLPNGHLDFLTPPFFLRPFPQRLQTPPPNPLPATNNSYQTPINEQQSPVFFAREKPSRLPAAFSLPDEAVQLVELRGDKAAQSMQQTREGGTKYLKGDSKEANAAHDEASCSAMKQC